MSIGQDICKKICERIAKGEIRNQLPSQSQLISEFHVSSGTIKLVLERLKQQHIIYGIHGKGTFISPSFRRGKKIKAKTVYIRLNVELLRHPFYIAFLTALDDLLLAQGMSLEFKIQPLQDISGKTVIFLESRIGESEMLQLEHYSGTLKVLAVNCSLPGCPSVLCDNKQGGYMVMEAIYNYGHRKVGIIAKDLSVKGCFFEERLKGALDFVKGHSDMQSAYVDIEEVGTSVGVSSIDDAVHQLYAQLPGLTAVFAFTDILAMDYLYRFRKTESVVGYGNSAFCAFQHPALASVNEQAELLAEKAAELVVQLYKGEQPKGRTLIPSVLVERMSLTTNLKKMT